MKKYNILWTITVLILTIDMSSCSSDESSFMNYPETETKGNAVKVEYEENPTTLTGRWNMVKVNDTDITQGAIMMTFLDNGYAVINNSIQQYLDLFGNFSYQVDDDYITFYVGGFVGNERYRYEIKEGGMQIVDPTGNNRFWLRKVKHEGAFDDINYAELKYRYTYTDTLIIASHMFYEVNDIPCYLVRSIHSNSTEWYENAGEIEGFQHEEGYEVTAVIWKGVYGADSYCDLRLVKILDKRQKQSENLPDYCWKKEGEPISYGVIYGGWEYPESKTGSALASFFMKELTSFVEEGKWDDEYCFIIQSQKEFYEAYKGSQQIVFTEVYFG